MKHSILCSCSVFDQNLGEPIRTHIEAKNRQNHMQDLMKSTQRITEAIQVYHTKSSVKHAHISHADPAVLCLHIKQKRNVSALTILQMFIRSFLQTLERECWKISNKPKANLQQEIKINNQLNSNHRRKLINWKWKENQDCSLLCCVCVCLCIFCFFFYKSVSLTIHHPLFMSSLFDYIQ